MCSSPKQIVGREKLRFASNDQLRAYYENKYSHGGYDDAGYTIHGVDISAMYHARRMEIATNLLGCTDQDVVLDAGCGKGALAAFLASRAKIVHAVDIAANAFDPSFSHIRNLFFQPMNLEALDFPDGSFDRIVAVETLEHLLSPERAIAEFGRVLKPGGHLVITYPTINRTLIKQWHLSPRIPVSEHLTEWSLVELRGVLGDAGFRCEAVEGIAFDLGVLAGLKRLNRFFALTLTRAALAIRDFPSNSMFVALLLTR